MIERHGLRFISSGARPWGKRGGGAGIIVDMKNFFVDEIDIKVPYNLEVKWAIIRARNTEKNERFREIIVGSFHMGLKWLSKHCCLGRIMRFSFSNFLKITKN